MYMKICWWHTMIEFWIRVHLNICIARHHKRWCFLRLGWTDPLKKLNAKLKYNIKREPVPQVLKWHTLYAQPSPYIQFFPCCTSDTPLCAFCNKRAVNAPRNLNSLRGISGGQGCTESLHYTYMMHCTHSILSRIPANVQQTRGENTAARSSRTHIEGLTHFLWKYNIQVMHWGH